MVIGLLVAQNSLIFCFRSHLCIPSYYVNRLLFLSVETDRVCTCMAGGMLICILWLVEPCLRLAYCCLDGFNYSSG